jgi:rRNA small subunit pseudouridine methyltransferase Nep1
LHELKIRSVQKEGSKTLLKVIKNPITQHLPPGCRKIGTTNEGEPIDLLNFAAGLPQNEPIVFVVGAFPHGSDRVDYVDQTICFSNYALSAAVACSRICHTFEQLWKIL